MCPKEAVDKTANTADELGQLVPEAQYIEGFKRGVYVGIIIAASALVLGCIVAWFGHLVFI
jgi:hypothetical protein